MRKSGLNEIVSINHLKAKMPTHDNSVARSTSTVGLGLLKLTRPKQWVKNGFVLAPLIFTGSFLDPQAISRALIALILFCIGSSAAYIVNDLQDIERDRQHPKKSRTRPLAAGHVTPSQALLLLAVLYSLLILG